MIQYAARIQRIQPEDDLASGVAMELLRKIPVAREEVMARVVLLTKMKKSASIEMESNHYVHHGIDTRNGDLKIGTMWKENSRL